VLAELGEPLLAGLDLLGAAVLCSLSLLRM
jgi:hypothetical protein